MKKNLLIISFMLMCALTLGCLAGCGSDNGGMENEVSTNTNVTTEETPEAEPAATGGGVQEWGDFTVMVPEGFSIRGYDFMDETNPTMFIVEKSDYVYFNFWDVPSEEQMMSDYNGLKNTYTNGQVEVSATYNGVDWVGFQYDDGFGGNGFEVYAVMGDKFLRVGCCGFTLDDATAETVLGSLTVK